MFESYSLMIKNNKFIFLISILFVIVFTHYIFNDNFRHWNISIVLILLFTCFWIKEEVIKTKFLSDCILLYRLYKYYCIKSVTFST